MSSRSNGVTKVLFTRRTIAWVVSSAGVLGLAHPLRDVLAVGAVAEHLGEQPGAVDEVLGRLGEQVVERGVGRAEAQSHGELLRRRTRTRSC